MRQEKEPLGDGAKEPEPSLLGVTEAELGVELSPSDPSPFRSLEGLVLKILARALAYSSSLSSRLFTTKVGFAVPEVCAVASSVFSTEEAGEEEGGENGEGDADSVVGGFRCMIFTCITGCGSSGT